MTRRLVIVGWDGADLSIVSPMLDAGQLPSLAGLVDRGTIGSLAAPRPFVRAMAWTAAATGRRPPGHGVCGDVQVRADGGGIQPAGHASWRAPAFWEILGAAGLATAVVGWPATSPADSWDAVTLVDDSFAAAQGPGFDAWPLKPGCIAPPGLRDALRPLRVHPGDIVGDQIRPLVPKAALVDQDNDPGLTRVAMALARSATVHAAATHIAAEREWDVLAVVYPLLADLEREFLRFRPPQRDDIGEREAEIYGDVVENGYRFQDMMLGRLLELAGPDATVLVVSPHGFATGAERPPERASRDLPAALAWHREGGILVAAGPGVHADALVHGAAVIDVVPTVLALLGLSATGLDGHPIEALIEAPGALRAIPAPPPPRNDEPGAEPAPLSLEQAQAVLAAKRAWLWNAAEAHLALGAYAEAAEDYGRILVLRPDDWVVKARLARCRIYLKDLEAGRSLAAEIVQEQPELPWGHILLGGALALGGDRAGAAPHFAAAREKGRGLAHVTLMLGAIRLLLKDWPEAEVLFREAVALAPASAEAHNGLGRALARQKRHEEAVAAFRTALGIAYQQPDVHLRLARSLARLGRKGEAAEALATALRQDPTLAGGKPEKP